MRLIYTDEQVEGLARAYEKLKGFFVVEDNGGYTEGIPSPQAGEGHFCQGLDGRWRAIFVSPRLEDPASNQFDPDSEYRRPTFHEFITGAQYIERARAAA